MESVAVDNAFPVVCQQVPSPYRKPLQHLHGSDRDGAVVDRDGLPVGRSRCSGVPLLT